jgi:hypothetical protein
MMKDSRETGSKLDTIHKMATHSKPQVEYPMTFKDVVAALLTGSSMGLPKVKHKPEKPAKSERKK